MCSLVSFKFNFDSRAGSCPNAESSKRIAITSRWMAASTEHCSKRSRSIRNPERKAWMGRSGSVVTNGWTPDNAANFAPSEGRSPMSYMLPVSASDIALNIGARNASPSGC